MVEYFEPVAMKFILVFAAVAAVVAVADVIMLIRYRGTARLVEFIPAVDSIPVIAGFMAFTGTCILLVQSAGKFAMSNIYQEKAFFEKSQRWEMVPISQSDTKIVMKVYVSALITAVIAWLLFFVLVEIWIVLRLLYRRYLKKLLITS